MASFNVVGLWDFTIHVLSEVKEHILVITRGKRTPLPNKLKDFQANNKLEERIDVLHANNLGFRDIDVPRGRHTTLKFFYEDDEEEEKKASLPRRVYSKQFAGCFNVLMHGISSQQRAVWLAILTES